jgi:hypothetical protein
LDFWNAVGLVLTFSGTALAFWQAYKAKSYRDEIQADRQKLILIELMPVAKSARDECRKIITPVSKPMRGADPQKIIHAIQIFSEKLQEYNHRISGDVKCSTFSANLRKRISEYTNETDETVRHKIADHMYEELNSVIEFLAVEIDRSV